eukprot:SAG11_NODE_8661_length_990_cov_0.918070_2_plen_78_part_00
MKLEVPFYRVVTAAITFQRFERAAPGTLNVPPDFFDVPADFAEDLKEKRELMPCLLSILLASIIPPLFRQRAIFSWS